MVEQVGIEPSITEEHQGMQHLLVIRDLHRFYLPNGF